MNDKWLCDSCARINNCCEYKMVKDSMKDMPELKPITGCGEYRKLHTLEDIYSKEDVIDLLKDIRELLENSEKYYEKKFMEPSNPIHEASLCGRMYGFSKSKEILEMAINSLKE